MSAGPSNGTRGDGLMRHLVLRLYVTGKNSPAERALKTLREVCERRSDDVLDLEIIDVLEMPHKAEQDRIIATPTLVKESPPPVRKIIGDLSDIERILLFLGLRDRNHVELEGEA